MLRMAMRFWAQSPLRVRIRSTWKVISMTQRKLFSMLQCCRVACNKVSELVANELM